MLHGLDAPSKPRTQFTLVQRTECKQQWAHRRIFCSPWEDTKALRYPHYYLLSSWTPLPLQNSVPWTLLYADDVVLASKDKSTLEQQVQTWSDRLAMFGLRKTILDHLSEQAIFCQDQWH
ncbi:hypothetical protein V3C99_018439 [Haemonchus contortus]|uniref:Reverse transcriptase domain-containing protein n=1 Tax=Haemonchus contortus TaxID=6289 RepID=A0A7I4Z2C1_HAECO